MDLLNVALQIVAIIAIIAVGAFIIVFLSDLLISVIDDHKGIFFRRGKSKDTDYNDSYISNKSRVNTPTANINQQKVNNFDFADDFGMPEPKKEAANPFKKGYVDLEAAKREQEMIEKAQNNFFDEEEEQKETAEELAQKERMARLEERNRQLEEEIRLKEQKSQEKFQKNNGKFKDFIPNSEDESDDEDNLEEYEALIKKINAEVKNEFDNKTSTSNATTTTTTTTTIKKAENTMPFREDIEDDFEDEEVEEQITSITSEEKVIDAKNKEDYNNLAKEIETLKAQLELERKCTEKLKEEAKVEQEEERKEAVEGADEETSLQSDTVISSAEKEYMSTLEVLEERLKNAKKELRINKREYVPLNKIKRSLGKDQVKLRRKEAQVARKKIALFGVNNNEIDTKKQAELEQDIDMLEGLKLSVQHCEEVMRENADRYPILEQTNTILTNNIKNITNDIENVEKKLKQIRSKK